MDHIHNHCEGMIRNADDVYCPLQGWWRTWQMPPQTYGSDLWTWPCVQCWRVCCQTTICNHWICLWQEQGTDPAKVSPVHKMPPSWDTNTDPEVPWHGHISITIFSVTFILHYTSPWTAQGHGVHMEWIIAESLWHQEMPCLPIHYPIVIWQLQAHQHSDWCLMERLWCHSTPKMATQNPLPKEPLWPYSSAMLTETVKCSSASLVWNLAAAPVCLPRMLLNLQNYNVTIKD